MAAPHIFFGREPRLRDITGGPIALPGLSRGSHEAGFALIEVLAAATLLVVGVLALLTVFDTANAGTATVRAREGATTLARQVTEAARSSRYTALTPESIEAQLQAQPGLAGQGGGSGWTVQRRGFLYSLSATVCSVDDPADGTGARDVGVFCSDNPAAGSADRNPDDYKRVRVEVSWSSGPRARRVHQVVLVNNPGSAGGPAVRDVTLSSPSSSPITSDVAAVSVATTTSRAAATVTWSVDGVSQATANGDATEWAFSWPISQLVDGTHLITAQAFDRSGLSGAMRSLTVKLNRFAPSAPTGFAGGRNGGVVDFEWLPNPERDIVGYRVFRVESAGGDVVVCTVKRTTACQDTSPPSGTPAYYIVGNDLDPNGQKRDGTASQSITVAASNQAPNRPSELRATHSNGVTTLSWTAPSPADPDGDSISFYRIYRDGTAFAHRYDRTGTGTELSYIDSRTDGSAHQYWVAAVDGQLAESPLAGPVTP